MWTLLRCFVFAASRVLVSSPLPFLTSFAPPPVRGNSDDFNPFSHATRCKCKKNRPRAVLLFVTPARCAMQCNQ